MELFKKKEDEMELEQEKEMKVVFDTEDKQEVDEIIDGLWAFQNYHPAGCK